MQNFDFFFICKGCTLTQLEQVKIDALRAVEDSPILKQIISQNKDDELCDWYDLGIDYERFLSLVEDIHKNPFQDPSKEQENAPSLQKLMSSLGSDTDKIKTKKITANPINKIIDPSPTVTKNKPRTVPNYEHIFPKNVTPPMGPIQLDKLERNFTTMDMSGLISQQNICVVVDNLPPQVVYTKKYISLYEVNNSILPGYDISADKWLFQRLTKTFDLRLMKALRDNNSFPDQVLSININVSTVLSKEFDKFIAKQKQVSPHPMVFEITLFDIMSNINEYFQAQEKLDKLGCKICICQMDIQSLYVLNRELLNVDFLKIRWNQIYQTVLSHSDKQRISQVINDHGKMRIALSNCDSKQSLKFGDSVGIVMYSGFEIDKLQGLPSGP
ncbi:MAG: EAL domain-containing protein [Kordiimonadaceae bacterium]|nr:EAL domain-containing protein [Kordiimonadaceae bacterium]